MRTIPYITATPRRRGDCYRMFFTSKPFIGVFLLTLFACAGLFLSSAVHAQSSTSSIWNLHTYIWNERMNLWARSVCTMNFGGISSAATPKLAGCDYNIGSPAANSPCTINFCDGRALSNSPHYALRNWNSAVKYYHNGEDKDGDGVVTETSTSDIKAGEVRGRAWSPVYGVISFDLIDFPADDASTTTVNESACYGLTGSARQARIVRVAVGANNVIDRTDSVYSSGPTTGMKVALVGCAYVPMLRDFILLSPVGSDKTLYVNANREFASSGDGWQGVHVHVVTDATAKLGSFGSGSAYRSSISVPYIQLFGCGWSQKNGSWSFGPNINQLGVDDCLPDGAGQQNSELLAAIDNTALGISGGTTSVASIRASTPTARIGQQISYTAYCPAGHSRVNALSLFDDAEDVESIFYPVTPLTNQQINSRVDRTISAGDLSETGVDSGRRSRYDYAEVIFSPVAALRLTCTDGHQHAIFPGESVAVNRGINVESLVFHNFTAAPSVIQEGGLVSLKANVTNFSNPISNGGYCTVTNTLSDERVLCFETKGFSPTQSLTLCGSSSPNRNTCSGDSSDVVVRDAVYELKCHYDSSPPSSDSYRDIDFCQSTYNHAGDSSWRTVGPFGARLKVLPNRLIDRHLSSDLSVPTMRKRRDGVNEYVDVSIPSASHYGHEIRIHEIDAANPLTDPDNPDRILIFFRNNARADARTNSACITGNRPVGETYTACIIRELYGTATGRHVIIGSLTHSFAKTTFTGKRLIAEIYTDDGTRSEKVVFDPNRIPPQPFIYVKRTGDGTITLEWNNPGDSSITNWFYRTKKGNGPYRSWRLMGGGPGSGSKISKRISFESCHTTSNTNCSRAGPALKNGIEYTVQIRALRRNVYGAPSNPVSARPQRSTCGSVQTSANASLAADCETLLAIERTLTGGVGNLNWSVTRPMTGWTGVTVVGGKLTALRINSRSLAGTIPSELALLTDLQTLDVSGNTLAGSIPEELGNMSELRNMYLNNNWLTGSVPNSFGRLNLLTRLWVHNNRMTGSVPSALAGLNNLISFQAHTNNLTGCVPSSLNRPVSTTPGSQWKISPQRNGLSLASCQ